MDDSGVGGSSKELLLTVRRTASSGARFSGLALKRSGVSDLLGDMACPDDDDHDHAAPLEPEQCAAAAHEGDAPPAAIESATGCDAIVPLPIPAAPPPMPMATVSSPVSVTHSRCEALVMAALATVTAGVHHDRGGCEMMEDETIVHIQENDLALFGVFDGHGGTEAAQFLKKHLHAKVAERLSTRRVRDDSEAQRALTEGFRASEEALTLARCMSGSTALVMLLQSGGRSLNGDAARAAPLGTL